MNRQKLLSWFEYFGILMLVIIGISTIGGQVNTASQKLDRAVAVADLPSMSDLFSVSYAELLYEEGEWVVYSDGKIEQDFEGSFRVCIRNLKTARHYWTCQWTDWFNYTYTGRSGYRQPEYLEWWANISPEVASSLDPDTGKIMQTCWRARVDDKVLEPICRTSTWVPVKQQGLSGG